MSPVAPECFDAFRRGMWCAFTIEVVPLVLIGIVVLVCVRHREVSR